ncbi:Thermostable carboxypeptidase 1 [Labilithrix luteola]|uniref:Metal-dependent carboxypeptidase n=1 Tax=Labilithrix luteola TaxID=1391654 RepID=A0A0K1Q6S0_9BACT|nr:carboxypeptidase M32 [Labilithrix luteola]AKV01531.1 Thermostable carboxypeptidase 1 [Labilithrix luteola]
MTAYRELRQRFDRHYLLRSSADQLDWDAQAMMPEGSGDLRGAQLGTLRVLAHEAIAGEDMEELLASAEASPPSDEWERDNLVAMRRSWVHAAAVPADLVEARSRATSSCELAWRTARKNDDFASLLPKLTEVVNLTRQVGQAKGSRMKLSVYDALADEYEPGAREASLQPLFARLERELPPLVDAILAAQARAGEAPELVGPFKVERQAALGRHLAERMGFDFTRGRLDVSVHPFCGGAAEDVRMTTRYDEADFLSSVLGVIHESGHALYEMGLPRAWTRQPVGAVPGMGLHESQSLLMEMQASRTPEFLGYLAGAAAQYLDVSPSMLHLDALSRHALRVERSFIRVEADEATYPLHIIVRFNIERALLSGDLAVKDLPSAFRDAMERIVGVRPETDRDGCLQDVHWPTGAFGYFPSYTIGAIAASQLFAAAVAARPSILSELSRGDFTGLRTYAHDNVHQHGGRFDTNTILERATGRGLDPDALLRHLRRRYLNDTAGS